jgi:hypothetical protein
MRALTLSIAFVEQMTLRISTSTARNGTNSAHASDHSFTIAGYLVPQAPANCMNRSVAASLAGAVWTGRTALAILSQSWPAAYRNELRSRLHHARLHDRARPHGRDRVRQALQPVADEHEHIPHTAVAQLGEHVQPVLGTFAAVTGPDAQDVTVAIDGDGHDHVDRPVGDLTISDLDVDGVDEHDRIHRIQRPVLPTRPCRP